MEKAMDSLVNKIVRGQANIDRMKAEIKTVTHTLWGWMRKSGRYELQGDVIIPCGPGQFTLEHKCEWRFDPSFQFPPSCWVTNENKGWSSPLYVESQGVHLDDVAHVHRTLELFVEGMLTRFPALRQYVIAPLWDAAGPDPDPNVTTTVSK